MTAKNPLPMELTDHRVRVGAERRNKTRLKLLECALGVLHEKGPDSAVIEDFIAAAGVSRGTFYNHFDTVNQLLLALATEMSDELLATVDPIVLTIKNPVERFSAGTRLYMHVAVLYPMWGAFISRVGTRVATRGQLIEKYLTRDLTAALASGLIKVDNVLVARDMVLGSIFYGIETMVTEPTHDNHPENLVKTALRGLCLSDSVAHKIAFAPLPVPALVKGAIFSKLTPVQPVVLVKSNAGKPGRVGANRKLTT